MKKIINKSQLGSTLGTIGAIGGILYSMKKGKGLGATFLFTVAFGIGGLLVGNSVSKFYE